MEYVQEYSSGEVEKSKKVNQSEGRYMPLVLILIVLASFALIVVDFHTVRIMSSVRAYINGESRYAKGEKDATLNLLLFAETGDLSYWDAYQSYMAIPEGDGLARLELLKEGDDEIIQRGFLAGQNHPDDIENMMWLFYNFQNLSLMKEPIRIWTAGDSLINQKKQLAGNVYPRIVSGSMSENQKDNFRSEIYLNTMELTELEYQFSESLGTVARSISNGLFYANVFLVLLIVGMIGAYAMTMIRKLSGKNERLHEANRELDRLVYSVSHDLKSPLASLEGLVEILRKESDDTQRLEYLGLMKTILRKQTNFIKETFAYSKSKSRPVRREHVDLGKLVNRVIESHQFIKGGNVEFQIEFLVSYVFSDPYQLDVILGNLISNAVKYRDTQKEDCFVKIASRQNGESLCLEVKDNGVGIPESDQPHIFEMYYTSHNGTNKSGLGLHIAYEAVRKLNGSIKVASQVGVGTTFTINLPVDFSEN